MATNTNKHSLDSAQTPEDKRLKLIKQAVLGKRSNNQTVTKTNVREETESNRPKKERITETYAKTGFEQNQDGKASSPSQGIVISAGEFFSEFTRRKETLGHLPWSTAELKITEPELDLLLRWLSSPTQHEIDETLERGWSKSIDQQRVHANKVVIGLLLHIIFAEHVRRNGTEGQYWGCIFNTLPWKARDKERLFLSNGQPNSTLRELLENSAQALQLRHTFGIDGVQQYFSTGFLQFGFTHRGFENRLGEWLAGYHTSTNAIETLCHGVSLHSESFGKLWTELCTYRQRGLTDQQFEDRIQNSCWILPEWIEDLKKASRQRMDLGTHDARIRDTDEAPSFLSEPKLDFSENGIPEFRFSLEGWIDLPLTSASYVLLLDEVPALELIRQGDGGYDPTAGTDFKALLPACRIHATIIDTRTGSQSATQIMDLWQPDEFIQVFKENGRRYADPHLLTGKPGSVVHVLFPTLLQLEIDGTENSSWVSPDGAWRLLSVAPTTGFELFLDGESFWSLENALSATEEAVDTRNSIIEKISIKATPLDIPSQLHSKLQIRAEETISIRWAKVGFENLNFDEKSMSASLQVTAEYLEKGVSIQLALEKFGQRFYFKKRIRIPFEGAYWIRQDSVKWEPAKVLHTQDAAKMRLCAYPRNSDENDDVEGYCITEGNSFRRRLANVPMQLAGLSGLGAPLYLQKRLFNNHDEPKQPLAESVIDGGCIHQIKICREYLSIFPTSAIDLKSKFKAFAWVGSKGKNMRLEHIELEEALIGDSELKVWRAKNDFFESHINAVGICYEGVCIGSWWNLGSWTLSLKSCEDRETAEGYARVIRLFNCPILHESTRYYVAKFLEKFPGEILLTLLLPSLSLTHENYQIRSNMAKISAWYRATGILFEDFKPEAALSDISLVLEGLDEDNKNSLSEESLARTANVLTSASPLLASSFFEKWLAAEVSTSGLERTAQIRQTLIRALEPSETEIEDIAQNIIRANSDFLREHCKAFGRHGFDLPNERRENLPYIFEYSITRRLAAAEYLKQH